MIHGSGTRDEATFGESLMTGHAIDDLTVWEHFGEQMGDCPLQCATAEVTDCPATATLFPQDGEAPVA